MVQADPPRTAGLTLRYPRGPSEIEGMLATLRGSFREDQGAKERDVARTSTLARTAGGATNLKDETVSSWLQQDRAAES